MQLVDADGNMFGGGSLEIIGADGKPKNKGVSQIIAGTNITISPTSGLGIVTINSTGGGGGGTTSNVLIDGGTFLAAAENVLIDAGSFI